MLSIHTSEELITTITGEYWDFDRLYFAISKFTGDYGIDTPCPFEGYDSVCENLLGLNYELRHAMQGDRKVVEHCTGIPEYWIAPAGQENRVRKEIATEEDEDAEKFNLESFEEQIMLNLPEHMDWDDFADLDEDDMIDLLIDLGFEYEECEDYLKALEQEDLYRFSRRDLPHFTGYNAYLSLDLPLSEVVFYALILHELLLKRDEFSVHCRKLMDENKNGLGDIHCKYYYTEMYVDLARLEEFSAMVFNSLYDIMRETYPSFILEYDKKPVRFLQADLPALNELVIKYANCLEGFSAKETINHYLEAFLFQTGE